MEENFKIKINDKVYVQYLKYGFLGIVKHIPNDIGDMWEILSEHSLIMINSNCSDLVGIFKSRKDIDYEK